MSSIHMVTENNCQRHQIDVFVKEELTQLAFKFILVALQFIARRYTKPFHDQQH